jgi:hypothetical protein
MKKQETVKFSLKIPTSGTVIGVGSVEKVEIPAGTYEMTPFRFDGCRWLAHQRGGDWIGKTLGDWFAFVSANPSGTTTLTSERVTELSQLEIQDMPT